MKIRHLQIARTSFQFCSLTFGQVEQLLDPEEPTGPLDAVAQAIQNAGDTIAITSLKQLLDVHDFHALYEQILEASGLKKKAPDSEDREPVDFAAIRGALINGTTWTLDDIEKAPFCNIQDLLSYWKDFPPTAISLRHLLGAFTSWEPTGDKRWQSRQHADDKPISGVDYQFQAQSFDNLPLSVQSFLLEVKKEKHVEPEV